MDQELSPGHRVIINEDPYRLGTVTAVSDHETMVSIDYQGNPVPIATHEIRVMTPEEDTQLRDANLVHANEVQRAAEEEARQRIEEEARQRIEEEARATATPEATGPIVITDD